MLLDVRSPAEFAKGHIPGAINLPLFSDEERAQVGTTYKQVGADAAFELGLEIVGPKMADLYRKGRGCASVYCWRGGMRSEWMGRLLGVPRLEGGYKAYRRKVLDSFAKPRELIVLGGYTGSGKTAVLKKMKRSIDLEQLANHRGSAFGKMGEQPTQEMFENLLSAKLDDGPIWVEDESRKIGKCTIPNDFYDQMRRAPVVVMEVSQEERTERLLREYSELSDQALKEGILQLQKRLGSERTREALQADRGKLVNILLHYYDRTYQFCLGKKLGRVYSIRGNHLSEEEWAIRLEQKWNDWRRSSTPYACPATA